VQNSQQVLPVSALGDGMSQLLKLRREQFNLRMARATGQAAKPDQFAKVRKNIARVKTVLAQSKVSGGKA